MTQSTRRRRALHLFLCGPGLSVRSVCKAAIRPEFADVEVASSGRAANARLEGFRKKNRIVDAAEFLWRSVLVRWNADEGAGNRDQP